MRAEWHGQKGIKEDIQKNFGFDPDFENAKYQLEKGDGLPVLARIEESKYRPSKSLMEHVGGMIRGKPVYVLLDEQLVVFEKVLACARAGFHDRRKAVLLIKGGPGTGKSVIAINVMRAT